MAMIWLVEVLNGVRVVFRFDPDALISNGSIDGLFWRSTNRPLAFHFRGCMDLAQISEQEAEQILEENRSNGLSRLSSFREAHPVVDQLWATRLRYYVKDLSFLEVLTRKLEANGINPACLPDPVTLLDVERLAEEFSLDPLVLLDAET